MSDVFNFSDFISSNNKPLPKTEENIDKSNINHIKEDLVIPTDPIIKEEFEDTNKYILYKDKDEVFSCDLMVEGTDINKLVARLIIESDEWNLVFNGKIDTNGKCEIPLKKLSILENSTTGKIKLEIIAENTTFIPWENEFKLKYSKKVEAKINEKKSDSYSSSSIKIKSIVR